MKFAEVLEFPNVYENFNPKQPRLTATEGVYVDLKGKWASEHFKNENPIIVELACGRGEYSLALATDNHDKNYVGVDIKGARIWKGASRALKEGLSNVAFLRTRIEQVQLFFAKQEINELWITFPDPFLRKSKSNRRLTSIPFLDRYHPIFKDGGILHLKTDDPTLYEFSLETLRIHPTYTINYHSDDIYNGPLHIPELAYKTYYEAMHLKAGKTIKYIQATHHL